jgi:3',5'-cyclic-AMP phosphodiesterase
MKIWTRFEATRATAQALTIGLALACALAGCSRPGEERAYAEAEIGTLVEPSGLAVAIDGGLARIARAVPGELTLWAQAPALDVRLTVPAAAAGAWRLEVQNVPADSELSIDGQAPIAATAQRHTTSQFAATLTAGAHTLRFAPPDAGEPGAFRFVALADIQTALPQVHEVFAAINQVPGARFVVFMGDLTERSELEEYQLAEQQLLTLDLPFYATLGNHELWADPDRFFSRFGRASFHFRYRDVAFTFADSGDAGLDPIVEGWVDGWLDEARDQVHVFLSHFPPIDPAGTRDGSYRSHRDGHRLLSKLASGGVDLTLFGHIHTYLAYENAGIPAYVSGGGGARQERWDSVSARHFLIVDLSAQDGVRSVALRRVP